MFKGLNLPFLFSLANSHFMKPDLRPLKMAAQNSVRHFIVARDVLYFAEFLIKVTFFGTVLGTGGVYLQCVAGINVICINVILFVCTNIYHRLSHDCT